MHQLRADKAAKHSELHVRSTRVPLAYLQRSISIRNGTEVLPNEGVCGGGGWLSKNPTTAWPEVQGPPSSKGFVKGQPTIHSGMEFHSGMCVCVGCGILVYGLTIEQGFPTQS